MSGPEILATDNAMQFATAVARAAALLRAGGAVALPTETVYGLAANALDARAVAEIFRIKGRRVENPIIVHVDGLALARLCVSAWPVAAQRLAAAFWPGPLTLVLPRSDEIPDVVTGGGSTVGIRWPNHPFMQAVIAACGFPLAAPSANQSNRLSPTTAEHVRKSLGDRLRLIIDGGESHIGIESTVVDLVSDPPRVLRPGIIHAESLAAVIGPVGLGGRSGPAAGGSPRRSPGLLPQHYAPRAKLAVWSWRDEADLRAQLRQTKVPASRVHLVVHEQVPFDAAMGRVSVLPHDAVAFARALYAALHRCDEAGAALIVVETVPDTPEWQAIADRLRRAMGA